MTKDYTTNDEEKMLNSINYFLLSGQTTDSFLDNVCLSYRHDYGLLGIKLRNELKSECREWIRAIIKNCDEYNPNKEYNTNIEIKREFIKEIMQYITNETPDNEQGNSIYNKLHKMLKDA